MTDLKYALDSPAGENDQAACGNENEAGAQIRLHHNQACDDADNNRDRNISASQIAQAFVLLVIKAARYRIIEILASSVGWMPSPAMFSQLRAPLTRSVEATNSSRTTVRMNSGAYHF